MASWRRSSGCSYEQGAELPLVLDDGTTSYVHGDNGMPVTQINGDTAT